MVSGSLRWITAKSTSRSMPSSADSTAASEAYPNAQRSVPSGNQPFGGHDTSARPPPIWAIELLVAGDHRRRATGVADAVEQCDGPRACLGEGTQPRSSIQVWLPWTPVTAGSAPVTNAAWFA